MFVPYTSNLKDTRTIVDREERIEGKKEKETHRDK